MENVDKICKVEISRYFILALLVFCLGTTVLKIASESKHRSFAFMSKCMLLFSGNSF